ncbi:uncharacterized protein VTP21DRAFT_10019 [Calcarisporiella thermophila]|uniref:uncharacterized protein n=1 Tax=Calcarisporiella thermophila TaxID=911321 RepID=UPI003741FB7C
MLLGKWKSWGQKLMHKHTVASPRIASRLWLLGDEIFPRALVQHLNARALLIREDYPAAISFAPPQCTGKRAGFGTQHKPCGNSLQCCVKVDLALVYKHT